MRILNTLFLTSLLLSFTPSLFAQDGKMKLSGSVQSDWLVAENDEAIGANKDDYRGTLLGNTYINLNFDSKYVTAGVRFETMEKPLPGYENLADTKPFYGTGVPYFQVTASNHKWIEATAGTFYEQFGSGFVFRAYEERTIGIDNSILGGRLVLTPYKGIRLKMLGGVQRYHFSWNNDNPVFGADLELELSQWSKALTEKGHVLTFGVSGVTRFDDETKRIFRTFYFNPNESQPILNSQTITLNLPKQVSAMDFRLQWQHSGYNILAEAVMSTRGEVLVYDGQVIDAMFHACSGGMTENSENVYANALPYLRGVESPYENPMRTQTVTVGFADAVEKINGVYPDAHVTAENIRDAIELKAVYPSGRVKTVRLGDLELQGKKLRNVFDLESAMYRLEITDEGFVFQVKGYGHGVADRRDRPLPNRNVSAAGRRAASCGVCAHPENGSRAGLRNRERRPFDLCRSAARRQIHRNRRRRSRACARKGERRAQRAVHPVPSA